MTGTGWPRPRLQCRGSPSPPRTHRNVNCRRSRGRSTSRMNTWIQVPVLKYHAGPPAGRSGRRTSSWWLWPKATSGTSRVLTMRRAARGRVLGAARGPRRSSAATPAAPMAGLGRVRGRNRSGFEPERGGSGGGGGVGRAGAAGARGRGGQLALGGAAQLAAPAGGAGQALEELAHEGRV